jgi:hypothetical protein
VSADTTSADTTTSTTTSTETDEGSVADARADIAAACAQLGF